MVIDPAHVLVRADDSAAAGEQRPVSERLQHSQLGAPLGGGVVLAVVAVRVAGEQRRALVRAGRPRPLVDAVAGDVSVVTDPVGEQPRGVADHMGRTGPGVDDRVPLPLAERRADRLEVRSVGHQRLGAGRRRTAQTAVEGGDLVSPV